MSGQTSTEQGQTPRNYVAIATQYMVRVLDNRVDTCKWVKRCAERQAKDLERWANEESWPYYFDQKRADKICKFIESLPHIEGPLAGTKIKLEPWQVFILTTVFGWVNKHTGFRRFRRVYIEVPRGNGKSALSSGVGLYMLGADKEGGAQVVSAASAEKQAKIVFRVAKEMIRHEAASGARERFGITPLANTIIQESSSSRFWAVASDSKTLDGLNVHFGCLDELHAHRTDEVYGVIETATGKRPQSMLWSITTAGFNHKGICKTVRDDITKILDGQAQDESYFGIIYTIDKEDDWTHPSSWRKANPNFGVSVYADDLEQKAKKAMRIASQQPNFKTKHLNVWVNADSTWLDPRHLDACIDEQIDDAEFEDNDCYVGLDAASKLDLSAKVRVFTRADEQGKVHYYAFGTYWLPQEQIEKGENSHYAGWVEEGFLIESPGETTDFNQIEQSVREDASRFTVKEVDHDPFQLTQMVGNLTNDSIECVDIPRNVKFFSPVMKEFEAVVAEKRFHYSGDPVMKWAFTNVVVRRDANDNYFPRKAKNENKIDPVIALLLAFGRAYFAQCGEDDDSIYNEQGIMTL